MTRGPCASSRRIAFAKSGRPAPPFRSDRTSRPMVVSQFLIIAGLIFVNGFFVAAEFALVKVRTSQIDQLVEKGNWAAKLTSRALDHLDAYLSASQLGITVASLALGYEIDQVVEMLEAGSRVATGIGEELADRPVHTDARLAGGVSDRDVPPHGPRGAGPQEPGDPLGQDDLALDGARPDRLLLPVLPVHLAAEQREQPDPPGDRPWAIGPRRGGPHRRRAAAHRRRERRRRAPLAERAGDDRERAQPRREDRPTGDGPSARHRLPQPLPAARG